MDLISVYLATIGGSIVRIFRVIPILSLVLFMALGAHAQSAKFPEAKPETVGFSTERLKRLDAAMKDIVDKKQLAGIVTVVARHGKVVHQSAHGMQDIASGAPMHQDSIVRIYSMTKPITGVAMMMLYEEGKWRPSDPISRYIPEFKDLKVFAGLDSDGKPILEAPAHAPTMGELMSHTAGFTYGLFGNSPVDKIYQQENPLGAPSLKDFIDKMAKIPLAYQPGEGWVYSVSVDIQGYLVEKLSGQAFPEFLRERIFEPLGMKDTAFFVPKEKLDRLATVYSWDPRASALNASPREPSVSDAPGLPSGGGGLFATASDYLRFTQMVLNGGELNGARLLAPSSVELMRTNHVAEHVKNGKFGIGIYRMQPGLGFGYDFAILEEPRKLGSTAGAGTFLWDGIAGTWFWIDPTNDVIFIGMIQRRGGVPGAPHIEDLTRALTYQALVDPKK
jgi:CubicO group peptidase (beta-lactamase class C family)